MLAIKDRELPETILQSFPMVGPLVGVYGPIIFYLENLEKVEAYLRDQERLWGEVKTKETVCLKLCRRHSARLGNTRPPPASLKIRFLAGANFNQKIVAGLLLRELRIDFELPQNEIPNKMEDPQVLALGAASGRIIVTHDVKTMPDHFSDFVVDQPRPSMILVPKKMPIRLSTPGTTLTEDASILDAA